MSDFDSILRKSKKVLITSHIKPDFDAVCSATSMYDYLSKVYTDKEYEMAITSEINHSFSSVKHIEKIKWVRDIADIVNEFDTIIFLDGNSRYRFSNEPEKIDLTRFKTICLDHHPNVADKFDLDLSNVMQSAATAIVYKLFFRNKKELIDREIAKTLLLGIIADTGTFKYLDQNRSETLIYAKELLDIAQTDIQILEMPMTQMSSNEFELIKVLMDNTKNMEMDSVPEFTYSFIPLKLFGKYTGAEIKNASDKYKIFYLRQIDNCKWGFVVTPDSENKFSISFRSTPGNVNARNLATAFGGGGHIFAAGGHAEVDGEIKESIDLCDKVIEYLRNNKIELTEAQ
jgi:bifunctional oligoribonuclease and PAP phosphatase NrnA